jgi:hypothetical protein
LQRTFDPSNLFHMKPHSKRNLVFLETTALGFDSMNVESLHGVLDFLLPVLICV